MAVPGATFRAIATAPALVKDSAAIITPPKRGDWLPKTARASVDQ
jgi:hypothetical protein